MFVKGLAFDEGGVLSDYQTLLELGQGCLCLQPPKGPKEQREETYRKGIIIIAINTISTIITIITILITIIIITIVTILITIIYPT